MINYLIDTEMPFKKDQADKPTKRKGKAHGP